jgi:hypothetical protein
LWGLGIRGSVVPDPGHDSIKDGCPRLTEPPGGSFAPLTTIVVAVGNSKEGGLAVVSSC